MRGLLKDVREKLAGSRDRGLHASFIECRQMLKVLKDVGRCVDR
jgi:hypothetical protein